MKADALFPTSFLPDYLVTVEETYLLHTYPRLDIQVMVQRALPLKEAPPGYGGMGCASGPNDGG
jgi:hypothetical protein